MNDERILPVVVSLCFRVVESAIDVLISFPRRESNVCKLLVHHEGQLSSSVFDLGISKRLKNGSPWKRNSKHNDNLNKEQDFKTNVERNATW